MSFDRNRHHRHSIRLKGYDYAQAGAYFVTICTKSRELFFDIPAIRGAAETCWQAIPDHTPAVELDEWVVMPNHLHGIIVITNDGKGVQRRGVQLNAPTANIITEKPRDPKDPYSTMSPRVGTLSVMLRTYKAAVTTICRRINHPEFVWQRNYYEHIIRNDHELQAIRKYISNNPLKWDLDRDNPTNRQPEAKAAGEYLKEIGIA